MFYYLPFSDENLEFVIREGVLGVFCLDDAVDVVFASLDLLSKDLYLFLLKLKENNKILVDSLSSQIGNNSSH